MINKIREFSLPLIVGVIAALIWANTSPDSYNFVFFKDIQGTHIDVHWLIENVFMVFFFGIAMVEIVKSVSPGGALNPIKKAINPILATFGGVLGPVGLFFLLNAIMGSSDFTNGWGICTATDIAISWLVARIIFGKNHPATSFLLLLAVADDAIGLGIIAIFYPEDTPRPLFLLLCLLAMVIAYGLNKLNVTNLYAYILICGSISWVGMYLANISPALSLVLIVPFFPKKAKEREGMELEEMKEPPLSALEEFEEIIGPIVDFGLVFFGLANAGVVLSDVSSLTAIIALSTILGKTLGIFLCSEGGRLAGFPRPEGMGKTDTLVAGITGGIGLTVALFVANAAFAAGPVLGAAKMGALFTVAAFPVAFIVAKVFGVTKKQ